MAVEGMYTVTSRRSQQLTVLVYRTATRPNPRLPSDRHVAATEPHNLKIPLSSPPTMCCDFAGAIPQLMRADDGLQLERPMQCLAIDEPRG